MRHVSSGGKWGTFWSFVRRSAFARLALVCGLILLARVVVAELRPSARSRKAIGKVSPALTQALARKGLRFGAPIFIRIFKESKELEVWVRNDQSGVFDLFKTYTIRTFSGKLGPKLKDGDRQAPEGFYYVIADRLNPRSKYHLAFNIGYPNAYDRHHGRTGSAIMVHGRSVSSGCFAMGDPAIEEIYALADTALSGGQKFFRVHVFPFRMTSAAMAKHEQSPWLPFWRNLRQGYDSFEKAKQPPNVLVSNGKYTFEAAPAIGPVYPWKGGGGGGDSLAKRIPAPQGCVRVKTEPGSFGEWLRGLPLKPKGAPVLLHNGQRKSNQQDHAAVIDIDVGKRDLQQCADAVIRLRAEYLYSRGNHKAIHFNFTSGDRADFGKWADGWRPVVRGNKVSWRRSAKPDASHAGFRAYLITVFVYVGSASLSKELQVVGNLKNMQIGDVFIRGGFPGHAVIVLDMARNRRTGKKVFLLAQSYMPAQQIHLLKNPARPGLSPWYDLDIGASLQTPEWTFTPGELKRFQ